jgi:enamine deaminase RidA (YjgF/YER057c/UK114 family)
MMDVAKVHGKFFGEILPVSTGVEVSALIDDKLLVEIEASAIISSSS